MAQHDIPARKLTEELALEVGLIFIDRPQRCPWCDAEKDPQIRAFHSPDNTPDDIEVEYHNCVNGHSWCTMRRDIVQVLKKVNEFYPPSVREYRRKSDGDD